ncbi:hypothetical protein PanWU01x14_081550, partial [Parasponia andersonii]
HRRVFAGSHPRLSDPAWSSEICELARAREQLENPASVVQDTWTTGVKPLQQWVQNVSLLVTIVLHYACT